MENNELIRMLGRVERMLGSIAGSLRELANLKSREVDPSVNPSDKFHEELKDERRIRALEKQNKILIWTAIVGWIIAIFSIAINS